MGCALSSPIQGAGALASGRPAPAPLCKCRDLARYPRRHSRRRRTPGTCLRYDKHSAWIVVTFARSAAGVPATGARHGSCACCSPCRWRTARLSASDRFCHRSKGYDPFASNARLGLLPDTRRDRRDHLSGAGAVATGCTAVRQQERPLRARHDPLQASDRHLPAGSQLAGRMASRSSGTGTYGCQQHVRRSAAGDWADSQAATRERAGCSLPVRPSAGT